MRILRRKQSHSEPWPPTPSRDRGTLRDGARMACAVLCGVLDLGRAVAPWESRGRRYWPESRSVLRCRRTGNHGRHAPALVLHRLAFVRRTTTIGVHQASYPCGQSASRSGPGANLETSSTMTSRGVAIGPLERSPFGTPQGESPAAQPLMVPRHVFHPPARARLMSSALFTACSSIEVTAHRFSELGKADRGLRLGEESLS